MKLVEVICNDLIKQISNAVKNSHIFEEGVYRFDKKLLNYNQLNDIYYDDIYSVLCDYKLRFKYKSIFFEFDIVRNSLLQIEFDNNNSINIRNNEIILIYHDGRTKFNQMHYPNKKTYLMDSFDFQDISKKLLDLIFVLN